MSASLLVPVPGSMLRAIRGKVALASFAGLAVLGACADGTTSPGLTAPDSPAFVVGISTARTIQVCVSSASPAGSYSFAISGVSGLQTGDVVVSSPVSVSSGNCVDVFTRVTSASNDNATLTVTTTAPAGGGSVTFTCVDDVADSDPLCSPSTGTTTVTLSANASHGPVATFTFVAPAATVGCTFTFGWYKNQGFSDVSTDLFFETADTWQEVLTTKPKGNNYYNLAFQYIAAVTAIGSDTPPAAVAAAIADAEFFFTDRALGDTTGYIAAQLIAIIDILRNFNEGLYAGWPHCGTTPTA